MEDDGCKFFCCPECGARYKITLDGKKYKCKKCGQLFQATDLTHSTIIVKPIKQTSDTNKRVKLIFIPIGLLLIIVFFICVSSINKASKSSLISTPDVIFPPPPLPVQQPEPIIHVTPKPNPLYEPKLELLSWNWSEAYSYYTAEGEVKNISGESMERIEVIVLFYDQNDTFIKSASAMIDYNPILPGQTSPFKAMTTSNPAIKKARIQFKEMFGGTIPYRSKK